MVIMNDHNGLIQNKFNVRLLRNDVERNLYCTGTHFGGKRNFSHKQTFLKEHWVARHVAVIGVLVCSTKRL